MSTYESLAMEEQEEEALLRRLKAEGITEEEHNRRVNLENLEYRLAFCKDTAFKKLSLAQEAIKSAYEYLNEYLNLYVDDCFETGEIEEQVSNGIRTISSLEQVRAKIDIISDYSKRIIQDQEELRMYETEAIEAGNAKKAKATAETIHVVDERIYTQSDFADGLQKVA